MITVNVSELKSRLSHYLRAVRGGEVVLVRDRDRVVARLDAVGMPGTSSEDQRLARLEETGAIRRRHTQVDASLPERRVKAGADIVDALLADRNEGR